MFKQVGVAFMGAIATFAALPSQAATNLVANGNFESTGVAGNFQFDASYAPGASGLTGWTSTPGYNLLFHSDTANSAAGNAAGNYSWTGTEYMRASTASPVGGNFVALDGDPSVRGTLSQTITGLTAGQTYNLQFYWGAGQLASRTGATTEQLQVNFGDSSFSTPVLNNASEGFTGWNLASTSFTAKSGSQVLSFLSVGTPTGLPPVALLDGVSLTAAVPEASTWMMMIVGFGAIGFSARRSRTKVAFG